MPLKRFSILFALILILAGTLRLPHLAQRPMHTDEAVHAIKFKSLLENGVYEYDPFEYHGPVLNYASLIPAWIKGADTIVDVSEFDLRLVTVIFGFALIALLWFFRNIIGKKNALVTALFLSLSPAFVFFSRYYIMEVILIFFTLLTILFAWLYVEKNRLIFAVLTGISLGMMHATKETCVIAWFAMFVAWWLTRLFEKDKHRVSLLAVLLMISSAFIASALFFSSFTSNWSGVLASFKTYAIYLQRGVGGFQTHIYPWYYYFKWIVEAGEWPFLFLGLIGSWFALFKNTNKQFDLARFFVFYTLVMILVYSIISYKTPWSMMGFHMGLIFLSAFAIVRLFSVPAWGKWIGAFSIIVTGAVLLFSTYQFNFVSYADEAENPYVYGHTHTEITKLVQAVNQLSEASALKNDIYIEIVAPGGDYWPLPWYLRDYPHVGYWNAVNMDVPAAPLIIASPAVEHDVIQKLYELPPPGKRNMYLPFFGNGVQLRAFVELDLYVEKSLYDEWWRLQP